MNKKLSYLEGWISILVNTLLFAFKLFVGIFSGSIAIIADAWHTLSDSLSSIVVIAGTKLSSKPADKKHPFGHGRIELMVSLIIGFLLLITALNLITDSVSRIQEQNPFTFHPLLIIACVSSIIIKEALAQFSFWAYRKTKATSLKADGWHHRSDAISSLIILVGIFLGKYWWWIDGAMGIIVALLIGITALQIIRDAINPLIGEQIEESIKNHITNLVAKIQPECAPHHFHYHNYGNHKELTFHIYLDGNMKIIEGHEIADKIEKSIAQELAIETTVHIDAID